MVKSDLFIYKCNIRGSYIKRSADSPLRLMTVVFAMEAYCLLTFSNYWITLVTFKHDHGCSLTCCCCYYKRCLVKVVFSTLVVFLPLTKNLILEGRRMKKQKNIIHAINSEGLMHTMHINSGYLNSCHLSTSLD